MNKTLETVQATCRGIEESSVVNVSYCESAEDSEEKSIEIFCASRSLEPNDMSCSFCASDQQPLQKSEEATSPELTPKVQFSSDSQQMMQEASHDSFASSSDSLGSDDAGARLNLFATDNTTTVVNDDIVTSLQACYNNFP